MTTAAMLRIVVTADGIRGVQGQLRTVQGQLKSTGTAGERMGAQLSKGLKLAAFGVGGGLAFAVKKAADFEQQMSSLGAVTEANARQMDQFKKQAMAAGAATKFSALDAARAQTELAKGGLSVRQIMRGGLRSALALAAAGEMDLADAASTTANAMKLFGLRGKDSMKVADALATAANKTTADVTDFAMALKMGGSVAKLAGLNLQQTVSILEALADAGIKNSDAGTSLKTFFLQIATPTAKAKKAMAELNVELFDQQGNLKSIPAISENLRQAFGKLTKEQFLNKAGTIAGSDAIRTLYSLYSAGPRKLAGYEKGLSKSGTAADVAAKKQDNLKGKLENLQGTIETIAISVGLKLLPGLTDAADKINKVLNNPRLTTGEKFQKLSEMIGKAVNTGLTKAVDLAAKYGPKIAASLAAGFIGWWSQANPLAKILGAAAIIRLIGGPGALRATGALIGRYLGSGIAVGTATAAAGGGGAGGAAAGAAGGGLIGMLRGKVLPVAKRVGLIGVGLALADSMMTEFGRRTQQGGPDMFKALEAAGKGTSFAGLDRENFAPLKAIGDLGGEGDRIEAAQKLSAALKDIGENARKINPERANELREALSKLGGLSGPVKHQITSMIGTSEDRFFDLRTAINKVKRSIGDLKAGLVFNVKEMRSAVESNLKVIKDRIGLDTKKGWDLAGRNFQSGLNTIQRFIREGKITVKGGMEEINRMMRLYSKLGADGAGANFDNFRRMIARTMSRGGKTTQEGLAIIKDLFVKELRLYGLSPKEALAGANVRTGEVLGGRRRQDFQRGGPINMGAPTGDTVPAMLERGEYVLNRRAVAKIGKPQLDSVNFASAPRFQQGGIAGMVGAANKLDAAQFPYLWGGGHQGSPAPFGPMDCSGAVSYVLQHGGVQIPTMVSGALMGAGKPGAGRVTVFANPTHTFMRIGNKYFGTSGANPGGGAGWFPDPGSGYRSRFAERHFMAGLGLVPRVVVGGRESPLRSGVQKAVDATRHGANRRLRNMMFSSPIGSGDSGDPGPFGDPKAKGRGSGRNRAHGFQKGGAVPLGHVMGRGKARKLVNSVWGKAKQLGGKGFSEGPPKIVFGRDLGGPTGMADNGTMWFGHGFLRALAGLPNDLIADLTDKSGKLLDPHHGRSFALDTIVHESAHSAQNFTKLRSSWEREGGADAFTQWAAPQIYRSLGVKDYRQPPPYYKNSVRRVRKEKSPEWVQHGQFLQRGGMVGSAARAAGGGAPGTVWDFMRGHGFSPAQSAGWLGVFQKETANTFSPTIKNPTSGATGLAQWLGGRLTALQSKPNWATLPTQLNFVWEELKGAENAAYRAIRGARTPRDAAYQIDSKYERSDNIGGAMDYATNWLQQFKGRAAAGPGATAKPQVDRLSRGQRRKLRHPFGGTLGNVLNKTLKVLRSSGSAKFRGARLRQFEDRLRKVGMPSSLKRKIKFLSTIAATTGDFADKASQLNVDNDDGTTTLGSFKGKTEAGWLTDQLGALFQWRNKLVDAVEIIQKRRREVAKLIVKAQKRLHAVADKIRAMARVRKGIQHQLDVARKHPKKNASLIASLKHKLSGIDSQQKPRVRERKLLQDRILPALRGRNKVLGGQLTDFTGTDGLEQVQGPGGPMTHLKRLPPLGVLGGSIFDVQLRLRDLAAPKASATDNSPVDTDTADMLRQLLREANLRTAVSETAFKTIQGFQASPLMGSFAKGGIALVGERGPELAHMPSGTRIHSAADTQQMLQPNVSVAVQLFEGEDRAVVSVNGESFETRVERVTRRQARSGGRGLPGRGGGYTYG